MKFFKTILALSLTLALSITALPANSQAAKVKLSKKHITMKVNQEKSLKITGTKSKVRWKSNKKKIVDFSVIKKTSVKIFALKPGKVRITAVVNGGKYTCFVTVQKRRTDSDNKYEDWEDNGQQQAGYNSNPVPVPAVPEPAATPTPDPAATIVNNLVALKNYILANGELDVDGDYMLSDVKLYDSGDVVSEITYNDSDNTFDFACGDFMDSGDSLVMFSIPANEAPSNVTLYFSLYDNSDERILSTSCECAVNQIYADNNNLNWLITYDPYDISSTSDVVYTSNICLDLAITSFTLLLLEKGPFSSLTDIGFVNCAV